MDRFRRFMRRLSPVIVDDPYPAEIQAAALVIHIKDAPILAAAKKAQVDFLITLDKKHFLSGKTEIRGRFKIVTPGEFLQTFDWRQILRTKDEKIYRRRAIINPSCSGECPGR